MKNVKRIVAMLLCVVMLSAMLSSVVSATVGGGAGLRNIGASTPDLPHRGRVDTAPGTNLNVRSGPGTNHSVIGSLPSGRYVTIVGATAGWYRVHFNGTTSVGYVSASFLWKPCNWDDNRVFMVVVNPGSNLNFRASAPTGAILGNAPNGTRVPQDSLTVTQGFRSVVFRGIGTGWMHRDFLGTPPAS